MTALSPQRYRNLGLLMLGVGALVLAGALCAGITFLAVPFLEVENPLGTNTAVFSGGAAALVYGIILVLVGRSLRRGESRTTFPLQSPLILLGVFVVALVIGQSILSLNVATVFLFPVWHVLGSLLVPLTILAFATRRLPPVSLRSMLAQFTWGGLVTITLALVFELVIGIVLFVIGAAALVVLLGMENFRELMSALRSANQDTLQLTELIRAQPIVLVVVGGLVLVLFVVLVPLLEEMLKATGPAILIGRRKRAGTSPLPAQVVLWGLAAGGGYAFTENMFNALGAVASGQGQSQFWLTAMLLRSGTSLMHMVATATVAVAWYQLLVKHKRRRFVGLFAAALAAHAVWNVGAVLLGGVGILNGVNTLVGAVAGGCALLFLVGLLVGLFFWLMRLVRWAQPPPVEIITASGTVLEIKG